MIYFLGNFMNMPLTVAKRYQIKERADELDLENCDVNPKLGLGDVVVIGVCPVYGHPVFGKIVSFNEIANRSAVTCQIFQAYFNSHYHAYEANCLTDVRKLVLISRLPYYLPATVVITEQGKFFFCVRHNIIDQNE